MKQRYIGTKKVASPRIEGSAFVNRVSSPDNTRKSTFNAIHISNIEGIRSVSRTKTVLFLNDASIMTRVLVRSIIIRPYLLDFFTPGPTIGITNWNGCQLFTNQYGHLRINGVYGIKTDLRVNVSTMI